MMETKYFDKQNENESRIDLHAGLNQQTLLLLFHTVEALCCDHNKKLPKKHETLETIKRALKIDLNALEGARYYQQSEQKEWLDMIGVELEKAIPLFVQNKSKVMAQKKAEAIENVKKIYESNNEELIEKFKELLEQRYEQAKQKLSVVEEKLKKMITPKDIAMQRGYSNLFVKNNEGFAKPFPKNNFNEKKRESEDNNPQQSNKRTMLEKNPQSSSTNEELNNDYQNN